MSTLKAEATTELLPGRPVRWRRMTRIALACVLALGLLMAGVAPFYFQTGARGIVRSLPLPPWLAAATKNDFLAYKFHAGLASVFEVVGAPPIAIAGEWFKATWHARSYAELEAAANGLRVVARRVPHALIEGSLCPVVQGWSDTEGWGARGRQLLVMGLSGLSCGDPSTVFGGVPDDVPITYSSNSPHSGLYVESWYPDYGLTPTPLQPGVWVHNLAHGEIVVLYKCLDECNSVPSQVDALLARLPRPPNGGLPRVIVTRHDDMDYALALLAWGQLQPLDHFDIDRIAAFYAEHVDRGIECPNRVC